MSARQLVICRQPGRKHPSSPKGLVHFLQTGAISQALQTQLRIHARSGNYPDYSQAARLMDYCTGRGVHLGPIGENIGHAYDYLYRADLMLQTSISGPGKVSPAPNKRGQIPTDSRSLPRPTDPENQTIGIVVDAAATNTAIFATSARRRERSPRPRSRVVRPEPAEGSYGRRNRQAIAADETRVAAE